MAPRTVKRKPVRQAAVANLSEVVILRKKVDTLKTKVELLDRENETLFSDTKKRMNKINEEQKCLENNFILADRKLKKKSKKYKMDVFKFADRKKKFINTRRKMCTKESELNRLKACASKKKVEVLVEKEREETSSYEERMKDTQTELEKPIPNPQEKPWKQCELCKNEYSHHVDHTPRVLQCGHTFCSTCLQGMATKGYIVCPNDFIVHNIKAKKFANIPKNFLALEM